jgi:acetolactate synthase-1/2/3 large subunit
MMRPITKFALEVSSLESLEHDLKRAIRAMVGVERRPAFLSVPKQLQTALINGKPTGPSKWTSKPPRILDEEACSTLAFTLRGTSRIAILAGNGVDLSDAAPDLAAFADRFDVPVATTLRAKGVLPENHRLSLGTFGYAGTRHATEALLHSELDVLIVIGSTLSQRDTLMWNESLHPRKRLVQIDIDPNSFGQNYTADTLVCSDAKRVLHWLMEDETAIAALEAGQDARRTWYEEVRKSERVYDGHNTGSDNTPIHPARVIAELRKAAPDDAVILVDSGAHRAFAGQYWEARHPRHYLTSTTMAPMGWAIPAALGAKMARPKKPTVVVTGDGCMLMHGIEIQSAAHHGEAIVFVVMNNHALGNVYLRARKQSKSAADLVLLSEHDWAGFAKSLGADGVVVSKPDDLAAAFSQAFAANGPFLVDVRCDPEASTPVEPWVEAKQEEAQREEEEHAWLEDHYGS